jgi:hypothetical protein
MAEWVGWLREAQLMEHIDESRDGGVSLRCLQELEVWEWPELTTRPELVTASQCSFQDRTGITKVLVSDVFIALFNIHSSSILRSNTWESLRGMSRCDTEYAQVTS